MIPKLAGVSHAFIPFNSARADKLGLFGRWSSIEGEMKVKWFIMPEFVKKACDWLGLSGDPEDWSYQDDTDQFSESIYGQHQDEEKSIVTPIDRHSSSERSSELEQASARVEKSDIGLGRITTVKPRAFNEARSIGEHLRDGVPVIMNLSEMDDTDARRLIDFGAGLTFALRGTIERVTSKVFLLSPKNVNVTTEDKERIKGAFYNQS